MARALIGYRGGAWVLIILHGAHAGDEWSHGRFKKKNSALRGALRLASYPWKHPYLL